MIYTDDAFVTSFAVTIQLPPVSTQERDEDVEEQSGGGHGVVVGVGVWVGPDVQTPEGESAGVHEPDPHFDPYPIKFPQSLKQGSPQAIEVQYEGSYP